MFHPGLQLSWFVLCLLVCLAALICQISSRRLLYLIPALLLAPLPALLFVHLMAPAPTDAGGASEPQPFGAFFAVLTCYLPPALGVAAAYFHQRSPASLEFETGPKSRRKDGRRRHIGRNPNLSRPESPPRDRLA